MTTLTARPTRTPRRHTRSRAVTVALCIIAVGSFLLSMTIGQFPVSPAGVLQALFGAGDPATGYIVTGLRLPRAAVGFVAGAMLALAGAMTQSFTRNPLASPDVIGITGGASVFAVATIAFSGGTYDVGPAVTQYGVPVAAAVGGVLAAGVLMVLSWCGDLASDRLVLVGIGLAAMTTAAVSWLLISASLSQAGQASVWLTGSLNARGTDQLWPMLVVAAVLVPAAALLRRPLVAMSLGDDVARSLGTSLRTTQVATAAVAALIAATAVAAAGPVQFVALVAPQVALRLTGRSEIPLLASAATGAALVTLADVVGRTVTSFEIPVGLITAAVGAPFLIYLLLRRKAST